MRRALLIVFLLVNACVAEDESLWRCSQHDYPYTTAVFTHRDTCYQFVDEEVYWNSARAYCMHYGGRLVSVPDVDIQTFLTTHLNILPWTNNGVWIGLHDRNSELDWEWVVESPLSSEKLGPWTYWGSGHPEGFWHSARDCVRMVRGSQDTWKWHETFCSVLRWRYKFICQYDALPATTPPPAAQYANLEKNLMYLDPPEWGWGQGDVQYVDNQINALPAAAKQVAPPAAPQVAATDADQDGNSPFIHITIVTITCSLLGLILIAFIIIFRRRRRGEYHQRPSLCEDNPTYKGPLPDTKYYAHSIPGNATVYGNPLATLDDVTDSKGDDSYPGWDYTELAIQSPVVDIYDARKSLAQSYIHVYEDEEREEVERTQAEVWQDALPGLHNIPLRLPQAYLVYTDPDTDTDDDDATTGPDP